MKKFLPSLDSLKATCLDCFKIAPEALCSSITKIINKSFSQSVCPTIWKTAKVNPVFKSGSKSDVNSYRPISILPTLSILLEKWTHLKLMTYLNNYKLLYQKQSGLRSEHSTESALILMIDSWLKAVNKGKLVGCVMVDFRKAVDLVIMIFFLKETETV